MTGLIARMDKSGLGFQTHRLARLLQPDRIMLIDSRVFNGNEQHPEWYKDYNVYYIKGFPDDADIRLFLKGIDVVLTAETFYNNLFTSLANVMKVKTICIANPEFFDWLKPNWLFPLPSKIIVPSLWMIDSMKQFDPKYLPTPIFPDEFEKAREVNLNRAGKPRYLFLNGKTAAHDRNGLESLYEALHYAKGDFEVVVKAQAEVKKHPDPRLSYDFSNPNEQWKLYADFDAMILPRRYAGQCLPMTEALQSALPVIMTDIEPNSQILPCEWLVSADKIGTFMARTEIDIYAARPIELAAMLDALTHTNLNKQKEKALKIAEQYDAETLRPQYKELLK